MSAAEPMTHVLEQTVLRGLLGAFIAGTADPRGDAKLMGLLRGVWRKEWLLRQMLLHFSLERELHLAQMRVERLQMERKRQQLVWQVCTGRRLREEWI